MASERRQKQVDEVVKEELAALLNREIDLPSDVLVTVTRVEAAGNLFSANIFVSVIPETKMQEVLLELKRRTPEFQQTLNKRLRMRPVPKIIFVGDTVEAEASEIEKELYNMHQNKK